MTITTANLQSCADSLRIGVQIKDMPEPVPADRDERRQRNERRERRRQWTSWLYGGAS